MKRVILMCFALLCALSSAFAQKTVTGTVTDAADSSPLPAVSIGVKGTSTGTITDGDGKYKITLPEGSDILVFNFVGYKTQEVTVGAQTAVDVALVEDQIRLEEVVVTALGFTETRDNTAASSSKIKSDAIAKSGETGVINGMAGKAAGVQIIRSSGDPGAGSYIQIRGQNTLTGDSQPLIVVDGIPVSNSSVNSEGNTGGVTQQSRLNDINPNDIANVQVLKGASAAALWGSRGANGVIMITTKKGAKGEKVNISFKSTLSVDQINKLHPLQRTFGQGGAGVYNPGGANSWGDKISSRAGGDDAVNTAGAYFQAEDGTKYYPITKKNSQEVYTDRNLDQVFQNGQFLDNSLSISGGDDKGTFYFGLGDLNQQGIIRNNSSYRRSTIRFSGEKKFNKYLKVATNASYARVNSNRIQKGSNVAGLFLGLMRNPADFDIADYKGTYFDASGNAFLDRQRSYRRYLGNNASPIYNNPLWTLNEQKNISAVDRFIVSSELTVSPIEGLDLVARGGVDTYSDKRTTFFPQNSAGFIGGMVLEENITESQINADLIARYVKKVNDKISFTGILGTNFNSRSYDLVGSSLTAILLNDPDFINANNATATTRSPYDATSVRLLSAGYYTAGVSFKDMLFVNTTGRYEVSNSFDGGVFFPSADAAFQFSKIEALSNSNILSFGKIRASVGQVGVQPNPYGLKTYFSSAFPSESWGPDLDAALYGGSYGWDNEKGNASIRPEVITSWEVGTDLRFLEDKYRLGITYFQTDNNNALIPVAISTTSGFNSKNLNAARLVNKGLELELGADIFSMGDFKWSIDANFARIRNKVLDLKGSESIFLGGFTGSSSRIVEGQPVGVLWGGRWDRDDAGKMKLDANGFPQVSATEGIIGNPNPTWRGGLTNTFSYKNLSLGVVFETFQGAQYWNGTRGILDHFGTSEATGNEVTLSGADAAITKVFGGKTVAQTFKPSSDGSYTFRGNLKDFGAGNVALTETWYQSTGGGFGPVGEQFVDDASWTRLREVSLSYMLNSEAFRNATKLNSVNFAFTGRNLWLATKWQGIDPETSLTGSGSARGLEYFNNPNTKSFLFSLTINY